MNTGTAATRAAASEAWTPVLSAAGAQGRQLGEQILQVAHQIAVHALPGPLTDPGRSADDKAALAARLFSGRVDERVVELLQALVRGRWSKPVDLVSALHDLGIEAVLSGARTGGTIDAVEQELFQVCEMLERDSELRAALEPSRRTETEARVGLAKRVFGPHLSATAMSLLTWCVRHYNLGGVPANLRRVTELAAAMQQRVIAEVVTAVPMTTAQQERLRSLLARRFGSEVELNTLLDPQVVGGVRVTVRDTVIDSTVRAAVLGLRSALVG